MCFVNEDEAVPWEECIIIINLWRHVSKARTVISISSLLLHFITGHLDAELGCQMALTVPAHRLAPDPHSWATNVQTVLRNCKTSILRPLCWVLSNIDRKSNKLDTRALESSRWTEKRTHSLYRDNIWADWSVTELLNFTRKCIFRLMILNCSYWKIYSWNFRRTENRNATPLWTRRCSSWSPLGVFRWGCGGRCEVTWPRYTPCTGPRTVGTSCRPLKTANWLCGTLTLPTRCTPFPWGPPGSWPAPTLPRATSSLAAVWITSAQSTSECFRNTSRHLTDYFLV